VGLPSPEEILRRGRRLHDLFYGKPLRAREALRRYFKEGRIVMKPQPDRTYVAESAYFPLLVLAEMATPDTPQPRSSTAGAAWLTSGCAGAIPSPCHEIRELLTVRLER
jgi:hypothetical protein